MKLPPAGTRGWLIVAASVVAVDLLDELTLSEAFLGYSRTTTGRVITAGAWAVLTAHLFGMIDPRYDPFHLLFLYLPHRERIIRGYLDGGAQPEGAYSLRCSPREGVPPQADRGTSPEVPSGRGSRPFPEVPRRLRPGVPGADGHGHELPGDHREVRSGAGLVPEERLPAGRPGPVQYVQDAVQPE